MLFSAPRHRSALPGFRLTLVGKLTYLGLIVLIPLAGTFLKTTTLTWGGFCEAVASPRVPASYRISFGASILAAFINAGCGLLAAWVLVRCSFPGKRVVDALVDLPFAVSPAISGLIYVLLFGAQGWFGPWLRSHDIEIIFTVPGIVLATIFVTFPFVARELIPLMRSQGSDEEYAALTPVAQLELARLDDGTTISVHLSRKQFRELEPQPGEQLFVELQKVRVFSDDYSIATSFRQWCMPRLETTSASSLRGAFSSQPMPPANFPALRLGAGRSRPMSSARSSGGCPTSPRGNRVGLRFAPLRRITV